MVKKIQAIALFAFSLFWTFTATAEDKSFRKQTISQNTARLHVLLQKYDEGISILIRQSFSQTHDLVMWVAKNETANFLMNSVETRLVPVSADMSEPSFKKGDLLHGNGDDSTPWFINGTYIGGNHGDLSVLEVTSPGHSCAVSDIGSAWKDEAGITFYLLRIPDNDKLWFLSENKGAGAIWKFNSKITGNSLTDSKGGKLTLEKYAQTQLRPCCRINRQEFLADGKQVLMPGQIIDCEFLDIVEDYEIINPGSVLSEIVSNPGKKPDYTSKKLDAVISNNITYRYSPEGATVIYHKAKVLQTLNLGSMGFVQQSLLWTASNPGGVLEYYIPKSRPFTRDGVNYDFRAVQDFQKPCSFLDFSEAAKTIEDSGNLPDRFIQFLGERKSGGIVRKYGFAMGYSLILGITVPGARSKYTSSAGFINVTGKTYPWALDKAAGEPIPAGSQYECVAYRQYFNPASYENATCVYWHKEGESYLLFADYHRKVDKDIIRLPDYLVGRRISVVQKTDSVVSVTEETVPEKGISISVNAPYGYAILKLD